MVELMLASHTALHKYRGVARRVIVFLSLSRAGRICSCWFLWCVSVACASLGLRLSKKLPEGLLPLTLLRVPTYTGAQAVANGR